MKPPSCAIADETAHQKSGKAAGIALRTKRVSAVHRRLWARAPVTVGVRLPSGRFGVRHFVPMGFGNAVAIEFQQRWMTLLATRAETMCGTAGTDAGRSPVTNFNCDRRRCLFCGSCAGVRALLGQPGNTPESLYGMDPR